jgi:Fe-S-cluster formation regulator IscX/YfhJ
MPQLTWDDAEDIALALAAKFPAQDPLPAPWSDVRLAQEVC